MRVRAGVPAGRAEIYVALLSGKTTGCCGHDAHLQSENSLKMSLLIAPNGDGGVDGGGGSSCSVKGRRASRTDDDGYK